MDVSQQMSIMRLSPVLVALLATSATLSLSNTARSTEVSQTDLASEQSSRVAEGDLETENQTEDTVDLAQVAIRESVQLPVMSVSDVQLQVAQAEPNQLLTVPGSSPTQSPQVPDAIQPPQPAAPATTPSPDQVPPVPPLPETPASGGATTPPGSEPRVLVAEVVIRGVEGDIQREVYSVIKTQAGRVTTRSQLQEDINAIFKTGYFASVKAVPEDTPLGVRVTFDVQVNPVLTKINLEGTTVLPPAVIDQAFKDQYGTNVNLNRIDEGVKTVTKWYQDNGYVLAQVVDAPVVSPDGVVTIQIAEGVVEDIQVRYVTKEGEERDAKGNPVRKKTRPFIVTREFELKPGDVFNRTTVERDLQRVFGLGIFEDVKLALTPGSDPRKVVVVANVTEKNTGSISAGAGISSASGLFGTVSYQQQNLGGNNQKLGAEIQVGQRELLFDLNFTDPWIAGDKYRTSYSINLFRRRTISLVFDGGDPEVRLANQDRPRVVRTGGGISFTRPLNGGNPFRRAEWTASLGLQYQRVVIQDADGERTPLDELGNDLSFSGEGKDDLFTVQLGLVRDRRNDPLRPTRGSLFRIGMEQSIPIGVGNIFFNRIRGGYSHYIPTRLLKFTKGCQDPKPSDRFDPKSQVGKDCPQAFAFNIQAGTVIGDLPPYEAFTLGGSNSVRGYDEGELAAARSFIQASIEYRFPIFSIVSGALFFDAATDFGTQNDVIGKPGEIRNKPGAGFGFGAGVRVQSPLGPIRIDYGITDSGDTRLHFGIGERF